MERAEVLRKMTGNDQTTVYTALTIAGSDSSGGAGIQADLKTFLAHGVYGMSAVTALTAQNTTGVRSIETVASEFLREEIEAVLSDIPAGAVKIGMIGSSALIAVVAETLQKYRPRHIVLDPVMISTSGTRLLPAEAEETLQNLLFPLATLVTPNVPELSVLSGMRVDSKDAMAAAGEKLARKYSTAVLCKGGHLSGDESADLLIWHEAGADSAVEEADAAGGTLQFRWFTSPRIDNPNTHGTGCTLSSAIAANLAKGSGLPSAVARAKAYLTGAIAAGLDLGRGRGPLDHAFALRGAFFGAQPSGEES